MILDTDPCIVHFGMLCYWHIQHSLYILVGNLVDVQGNSANKSMQLVFRSRDTENSVRTVMEHMDLLHLFVQALNNHAHNIDRRN